VDVVLKPGARVLRRVVDVAGRPVERARVRFGHVEPEDLGRLDNSFRADDHLGPRTFVADAAGAFVCDDVRRARRSSASTPTGSPRGSAATWWSPPRATSRASPRHSRGARASRGACSPPTPASPSRARGCSRSRACRRTRPTAGAWTLVTLETGPDGAYVLGGLPPGPVDVAVSLALGYKNAWQDPATARRDAVAAGSTGVDFRLVPVVDPAPK
jgi:hypothetical protein